MKVALVAGATGLIGKQLVYALLDNKEYFKVIALTRKELVLKHHKLEQVLIDFDNLNAIADKLKADDVFCCLGTTKAKTPNQADYRKIDHDYVIELAELCKQNNAKQFLFVSSMGANINSSIFYSRLKAETENDLKKIGFDGLHLIRPSLLLGSRNELRPAELITQYIMRPFNILMVGPLLKYKAIEGIHVAKAMIKIAACNKYGTHIWENDLLYRQL